MKFIATNVEDSPIKLKQKIGEHKEGFALDNYFYRSHVAFEQELDKLVFKSWLCAGHVSQIPNAGDYFLYKIGEDEVIITNDHKSGEVKALLNICRHRGARVVEEETGNKRTFVCPYHGWVFETDGTLKAARHMEKKEGFNCQDYHLKSAKVEVRWGLIFINFDQDAEEFSPSLSEIDHLMNPFHLDTAKIAHAKTYEVDANWKFVLENYLECYHCATSHRNYSKSHTLKDLYEVSESNNEAMWARSEQATGVPNLDKAYYSIYRDAKHSGGCSYSSRYALFDGYVTGSEDGKPVAPLMGDYKGYDGGAQDVQLGPLNFMLNYPDHCVLYRFTPRSLTKTDMEIVWFVKGDAQEGVDYDVDKVTWLWHYTTLEDEFIITRNSEGANSRFFEPGPYHPEFEEVSLQFVDWYLHELNKD